MFRANIGDDVTLPHLDTPHTSVRYNDISLALVTAVCVTRTAVGVLTGRAEGGVSPTHAIDAPVQLATVTSLMTGQLALLSVSGGRASTSTSTCCCRLRHGVTLAAVSGVYAVALVVVAVFNQFRYKEHLLTG